MEEKIKALVKELFDHGMTLDEIIEMVSNIASKEDFKRFKEGEKYYKSVEGGNRNGK